MLLLSSATRILATERPPREPSQRRTEPPYRGPRQAVCRVCKTQRLAFTHNDASNHWSIPGRGRQRQPRNGVSEVNTVRIARASAKWKVRNCVPVSDPKSQLAHHLAGGAHPQGLSLAYQGTTL